MQGGRGKSAHLQDWWDKLLGSGSRLNIVNLCYNESPLLCYQKKKDETPVTIPNSKKMVLLNQAGIVSWGIGCGEEGVPAVYANVAHVVCWIDHQVDKHQEARSEILHFFSF